MKTIFTLLFLFLVGLNLSAQLTTSPAFPLASGSVTITFNSAESTKLGAYSSPLYAHTGVKISGNDSWQHVIGSWGNNSTQPQLTYIGGTSYQLVISPDIMSYYAVPANEMVTKLCFVFRSADGSKQSEDLFIDVYQSSLVVSITSPSTQTFFQQNQNTTFSAISSGVTNLTLKLNQTVLASTTGNAISTTHTFTETGYQWLFAVATLDGQTVKDSLLLYISPEPTVQNKPSNYKKGINYLSNTEVGLVLQAPGKTNVYVLGDFNNWTASADYQLKKDGELFWLTLNNLTAGKEYVYQYWIDGEVQVADPYCDKIADPYDDSYISASVYPNIPAYPTGKAVGRASVLQTEQSAYQWKSASFTLPAKEKLNIYELLIRDFTEEGTYKATIGKLGYLQQLGVNAIELMPFSEFEGNSSWGYNPNFYFAPDKAYGTKNDLKELIDSIHGRGMIVIQDMVLNHAYNSCPLVQLYWDAANNRPAANNPWFNATSPNSTYSWGSDFNHESSYTKAFVDTVTSYWMTEYKVDGFRFDFTKGFTNTPGDGSAYDAPRIAILKRMSDHIWRVKPTAYIILEHFAPNNEELELTSYSNGMMVWGNSNYAYNQATMGWSDGWDFAWSSYQARGFAQPGLVAYMESHDEERLMYKNIAYGNSSGSYTIKTLATALKRNEMAAVFFFSLAGPKMIWQFGELGYDYSIDYNDRVGEKPVRWDYLDDADRLKLFEVYSAMLRLRKQYAVFNSGTETRNLTGTGKTLQLVSGSHHVTVIGNFGVTATTISAPFQHIGTWYEFFTGNQLTATSTSMSLTLQPGEYRLYSDVQLPAFGDSDPGTPDPEEQDETFKLYPNPASSTIRVETEEKIENLQIASLDGKILRLLKPGNTTIDVPIGDLSEGLYLIRVQTSAGITNRKFIKSK
ncbi:MAG: alpha-amylase family glycosyl hydrolase [Mangrovibacterium sp.]